MQKSLVPAGHWSARAGVSLGLHELADMALLKLGSVSNTSKQGLLRTAGSCLASEDGMEDSESAARCVGGSFKGKPASNQRPKSTGGHQQWPAQPGSDLADKGGGAFVSCRPLCMPVRDRSCVYGELTSAFPRISGNGTMWKMPLLVEARNLDFLGCHHTQHTHPSLPVLSCRSATAASSRLCRNRSWFAIPLSMSLAFAAALLGDPPSGII